MLINNTYSIFKTMAVIVKYKYNKCEEIITKCDKYKLNNKSEGIEKKTRSSS